ncbi:hypothetical protein PC116_g1921 [Phytophthora cactorum]|uniref:Uncharacterized protein n=1 Tax=Phytophthora cactorum TaxID=29920 RepID=A0A8T1BHI5_9STRA|nr:hypothetical protein PC114_g21805 [Phytophthora cactorum]KAG2902137.1 hypothetical protein PC117_g21547 [Phytophthora cactorum]KAG2981447.1 hypothetical protein PC119_g21023 [Phytophthora cactorum]KAG2999938.1 hypothetical protein PC120_g20807 [Phytophthora cactorum]KAG3135390.1 hypothetical protein C6341_g21786 [Phytophthora cactorum]
MFTIMLYGARCANVCFMQYLLSVQGDPGSNISPNDAVCFVSIFIGDACQVGWRSIQYFHSVLSRVAP